jgi:hypothetical protein
MAWTVISAFVLDQILGYQTMNNIRGNWICLVSRRAGRYLGGSRVIPGQPVWDELGMRLRSKVLSLGPLDAFDYVDVEIDGTNQTGITYQARVEVRTNNPGVSITPKVRNVTDATDAGTGSACTATAPDYTGTNQKQTIALTIASGIKKYRLMYTLGANAYLIDHWCIGELESFATA